MNYSDVSIIMTKEEGKIFTNKLSKYGEGWWSTIKDIGDELVCIHGFNLIWDDSIEEVSFTMEYVDTLMENNEIVEFARIGEEFTDVEIFGSGRTSRLTINRSIGCEVRED